MFIAIALYFGLYYSTVGLIGNNALWLAFVGFIAARGGLLMAATHNLDTGSSSPTDSTAKRPTAERREMRDEMPHLPVSFVPEGAASVRFDGSALNCAPCRPLYNATTANCSRYSAR